MVVDDSARVAREATVASTQSPRSNRVCPRVHLRLSLRPTRDGNDGRGIGSTRRRGHGRGNQRQIEDKWALGMAGKPLNNNNSNSNSNRHHKCPTWEIRACWIPALPVIGTSVPSVRLGRRLLKVRLSPPLDHVPVCLWAVGSWVIRCGSANVNGICCRCHPIDPE